MNIIFDFDGTICDSFDVVVKTANKYLRITKKKEILPEDIKTKGIEKLIKEYKIGKIQALVFVYKGRHEFAKEVPNLKTFKDIPKTLKALSKKNLLGIITSNSTKNVDSFLKKNKIANYFKFIESNSNLFGKDKTINKIISKYKLDVKETCYIGDETRDILASKKSGTISISVSWGFEDKKLLSTQSPNFIVEKPSELIQLVEKLSKH